MELRENVIEWINDQKVVTVTLSQKKYINKVKKLAQKYSDVEIIKENDNGTLLAHVPLKFIKISAPKQISDEQRAKLKKNLEMARKKHDI